MSKMYRIDLFLKRQFKYVRSIPPSNRSVVAGSSETTLECIANARCVPVPHAGSNNP